MGRVHEELGPELVEWLAGQHVFFVATAPSGGEGHVNVSPKGYDSFRVLGPTTVAYLDLTGSGVETIAHLRDDGRITIMFCAFDGKPRIVRLSGRGDVVAPDHPDWAELAPRFPDLPGARAVVRCELDRIADSCGYSIPILTYAGERDTLIEWAERRGPDGLASYHDEKNRRSIDGLPGLPGGADRLGR
jgi:hypothetical protein